jgi:hypothetical protein
MPNILCRCDEILSYGEIPSPIEWRIISDVRFDDFSGVVDAEEIYMATDMMLRCRKCGRLWVFWEGSSVPTEYRLGGNEVK